MKSKELSDHSDSPTNQPLLDQTDLDRSVQDTAELGSTPRANVGKRNDEWNEESRIAKATELGLREDTPWEKIVAIWEERERLALAKVLDLPEDTDRNELERVAEIRKLGLAENASWIEIYRAWDEQFRIALAKELELQKEWSDYVSWRNILATVLGIDITRPTSEADIIQRFKEIKKVRT